MKKLGTAKLSRFFPMNVLYLSFFTLTGLMSLTAIAAIFGQTLELIEVTGKYTYFLYFYSSLLLISSWISLFFSLYFFFIFAFSEFYEINQKFLVSSFILELLFAIILFIFLPFDFPNSLIYWISFIATNEYSALILYKSPPNDPLNLFLVLLSFAITLFLTIPYYALFFLILR